MKRFIILAAALLCAVAANAQQLKTAQGITIETEPEPKPKKTFAPIERGFEQSVEVGVHPNIDGDGTVFLSAEYITGYRFNDILFVGGGTGFDWEVCEGSLAMPIFANVRAYAIPKSRWQPIFGLSAGVVIKVDGVDERGYEIEHSPIGILLNPTIGVNYRISTKYSCYCSLGYMLKTMEEYYYRNSTDSIYLTSCLSIKFGFTF